MYVTLLDSAGRLRFTVPCAAFAADHSDGLLLLELTGADSENRAVWSHIVKARTERSLTATHAHFHVAGAQHTIRVVPTTKYHKVEQAGRVLLLHDGLSRFRHDYLLGGDAEEPSPWFLPALQLRLPIPVLSHWARGLWQAARHEDLVRPVATAYGPAPVWGLGDNLPGWEKLVQGLIKARKLTAEVL
jgi:hypothetical protein